MDSHSQVLLHLEDHLERQQRMTADVEEAAIDTQFAGLEGIAPDANQPLPFPANYFDLVWCSEVIEHLKDPARSLDEFRRVTASKGQIILTTPNSYALPFRLFSYVGLPPQRLQRPDHLHFFDIAEIERLCPDAEVYGYFPYLVINHCWNWH